MFFDVQPYERLNQQQPARSLQLSAKKRSYLNGCALFRQEGFLFISGLQFEQFCTILQASQG